MGKISYEEDVDTSILKGRTFAIIGYGSQGRAISRLQVSEAGILGQAWGYTPKSTGHLI